MDQQLVELHDRLVSHGVAITQALGITAGSTGGNSKIIGERRTNTLRRLRALVGYRLAATKRQLNGERAWHYRVASLELPEGCDLLAMQAQWTIDAAQESP